MAIAVAVEGCSGPLMAAARAGGGGKVFSVSFVVSLALARSLRSVCGGRGREAGSSSSRVKVVGRSAERARVMRSSWRPVRWEIRGRVWKLSALGRMCGRCVKGDGKAAGMASNSILVKAVAKWLVGAPMDCRVRVIQIMAVGGARALPRCL